MDETLIKKTLAPPWILHRISCLRNFFISLILVSLIRARKRLTRRMPFKADCAMDTQLIVTTLSRVHYRYFFPLLSCSSFVQIRIDNLKPWVCQTCQVGKHAIDSVRLLSISPKHMASRVFDQIWALFLAFKSSHNSLEIWLTWACRRESPRIWALHWPSFSPDHQVIGTELKPHHYSFKTMIKYLGIWFGM